MLRNLCIVVLLIFATRASAEAVMTYAGDGLTLVVTQYDPAAGTASGTLERTGQRYAFEATFKPVDGAVQISGTFQAGDDRFPFTAVERVDGEMALTTGNRAYQLREIKPGQPKPAQPDPVQPAAAAQWTGPLQVGTRLTFYTASATIPGAMKALTMNDKGDLIDENTGQRYSMEDRPGGAAEGFEQFTLFGANDKRAVFDHRVWQTDPTSGPGLTSADTLPKIATPAQGIDYWTPPAVLAAMPDAVQGPTRVGRLQFVLGGKTFNAIRISTYEAKMRSFRTYDLESGILLQLALASQVGRPQKVEPDGKVVPAGVDMMLIHAELRSVRQVDMPWVGMQASPALKQMKGMTIQGQSLFEMPAAPGLGVPQPVQAQLRFDTFDGEIIISEVNGQKVPRMVASCYIDPAILGKLQAGQVIDVDPVTQVRVVIQQKADGQLVIREENRLQQSDGVYDLQTGLLVGAQRTKIMGGGARETLNIRTSFQ